MQGKRLYLFARTALIQLSLCIALSPPSLAREWEVKHARGTIRVVDLYIPGPSVTLNCTEGLISLDKDNNWVPCLARNWRWLDDRTIEFKLRRGVTFQNGEWFNADALRINWDHYRSMENPRVLRFTNLPDATELKIIDDYTVRFILPEPDGLLFPKLMWFFQAAPSFFKQHRVAEKN